MRKRKYVIIYILSLVLIIFPFILLAQDPGDPGGDPGVPIDGGLTLFIAAGVGYGVK